MSKTCTILERLNWSCIWRVLIEFIGMILSSFLEFLFSKLADDASIYNLWHNNSNKLYLHDYCNEELQNIRKVTQIQCSQYKYR